jgi:HK97 family phage major capsid protein
LNTAARKLWGVPVTASTAIAAGTAVLIDTSAVAVDTDSLGVQMKWSESVSDDFEKNMLRARCEGRFGVSVFQGAGVVKVTLPAAA